MPYNPLKNFRRKSSGNALDFQQAEPAPQNTVGSSSSSASSFRVLERPSPVGAATFDGGVRLANGRPMVRPVQNGKMKSAENLVTSNRGSAATTHSAGSGHGYDTSGSSVRHSSSSTLPSSFEAELDPDSGELFPVRKQQSTPISTIPEPPAPTFMARAGRAMSFGRKSNRNSMSSPNLLAMPHDIPPIPSVPYTQPSTPAALHRADSDNSRDRSMTTSSYASTARPPQIDHADFGSSGADDFGNMFAGLDGQRQLTPEEVLPKPPFARVASRDSAERGYPPRSSSRNGDYLERPGTADSRRYSWDSRMSTEQLMSAPGSQLGSPRSENFPQNTTSPLHAFNQLRGYQTVPTRGISPEPSDARASPTSNSGFLSAQSHRTSEASVEQAAPEERAVWRSQLRRPTAEGQAQPFVDSPPELPTDPMSRPGLRHVVAGKASGSQLRSNHQDQSDILDSQNTTPRAKEVNLNTDDETFLFENHSPSGPASRAINPGKQRAMDSNTPKRMTRVQFEQAQKHGFAPRTVEEDDDKSADSDEGEGYEDCDDLEAHKKLAAQRRKQEATMSVYRQQMKKVTGSQISDLPSQNHRPSAERFNTAPLPMSSSMNFGGPVDARAGAEEDEDVPLGILQAHGFPSKTRPPNQLPGASAGYAASSAGQPGQDGLPPFARRLPQDPYFGAGLVNPSARESLAFGDQTPSMYGAPSPQIHSAPPGGLVGVIAGEERAKALRRGSPNPVTGGYGPIPLPSNLQNSSSMPQFNRSSSMTSLMMPHMGMPPHMQMSPQMNSPQMSMGGFYPQSGNLPGMPAMSPAEHSNMQTQQQMAQLMQMQAQMMQNIMAMQAGQVPGGYPFSQQQQSPSMMSLNPGNDFSQGRPQSAPFANFMNQGRTMSMTTPSGQWGQPDNMQQQQAQQRSNTMGSSSLLNRPNYAGSVYGMNLMPGGGPGQGYTPSIAPSERSNIGMPSRYRPVSTMDGMNGANGTSPLTGQPGRSTTPSPAPLLSDNTKKGPKSTIRVIEKPKGAPRSSTTLFGKPKQQDDDDDEGWAAMAKKRSEMKKKRATKMQGNDDGPALSELYQALE